MTQDQDGEFGESWCQRGFLRGEESQREFLGGDGTLTVGRVDEPVRYPVKERRQASGQPEKSR